MQDFRISVNRFDSMLSETTGLSFQISQSGKHNNEITFASKTNEGIDAMIKVDRNAFTDAGNIKWKYCADPTTDYWVTRNSSNLASLTLDFHQILKNRLFDSTYLNSLKK